MASEMGLNTAEAKELQERSEFIKRITDFAQFMHKEYIEDSDGDMAMMICASDRSFSDEKSGAAHIVMGGRATMTAAVASMMQEERMGEIFRVARMVADDEQSERGNLHSLRRRLRTGYGLTAFTVLWTMCIIGFQVVGIANWITTVSNLLLMAFVGLQLYGMIRDLRRKVKAIEAENERERRERMQMGMAAFSEMLKRIAASTDDDDDDDE